MVDSANRTIYHVDLEPIGRRVTIASWADAARRGTDRGYRDGGGVRWRGLVRHLHCPAADGPPFPAHPDRTGRVERRATGGRLPAGLPDRAALRLEGRDSTGLDGYPTAVAVGRPGDRACTCAARYGGGCNGRPGRFGGFAIGRHPPARCRGSAGCFAARLPVQRSAASYRASCGRRAGRRAWACGTPSRTDAVGRSWP